MLGSARGLEWQSLCGWGSFLFRRAAHGGWSCEFDENYPNALERSATNICFLLSLAVFQLDDGWPESEKGKDVDVKYIEERRRCEKISEERMNI